MTEDPDIKDPATTYLGDGVYATFDGYQVWVHVPDRPGASIALEDVVLQQLVRYAQSKGIRI